MRRSCALLVLLLGTGCPVPGPSGARGPQGDPGPPGAVTVVQVEGGGPVSIDAGVVLVTAPSPRHQLVLRQGDGGVVGPVLAATPEVIVWIEDAGCAATLVARTPLPDWPALEPAPLRDFAWDNPTCQPGQPFLLVSSADLGCYGAPGGAWYRMPQPPQLRVFPSPSQSLADGGCQTIAPNTRGYLLYPVQPPPVGGPFNADML